MVHPVNRDARRAEPPTTNGATSRPVARLRFVKAVRVADPLPLATAGPDAKGESSGSEPSAVVAVAKPSAAPESCWARLISSTCISPPHFQQRLTTPRCTSPHVSHVTLMRPIIDFTKPSGKSCTKSCSQGPTTLNESVAEFAADHYRIHGTGCPRLLRLCREYRANQNPHGVNLLHASPDSYNKRQSSLAVAQPLPDRYKLL